MENIMEFIKPELLVLVPVLYLIGMALKNAKTFADKHIPLVLGIVGMILATLWVMGTTDAASYQDAVLAGFGAITQGVLVAGAAVYCNQIVKQATTAELYTKEIEAEDLDEEQLRAVLQQMGYAYTENMTRDEMLAELEAVAEKLQE